MRVVLAVLLILGLAAPAMAEGFAPVTKRDRFVSLIEGRDLTRFGITLNVTSDGQIKGRAFGRDVTGAWRWNGDYFCRDLYWGSMDLGPNCQAVRVQGNTLRFISDQGAGQFADLSLR
ncbi:dihydrodipicolinate reductase [Roseovarius mucosus]|uniref:Dihydrodipicolinate reductase n=1 Tax=Roseovarius mucosus TaxID=215743 RepID=A0A1V0RRS1_9RHOB|nr:dihydrodipicolinate reductase [Roseovarius mucosus]ARE84470.1 dihydrodipicolinate reductase [Roseovarius mucosus]MBW4975482.1 dihydrodipicolinate reductase [Roseovarius mucosus]|tara:strand:- start:259 stop:612 length:354 start_codon:yes stop_codon:yes gene_type:complete